MNDDLRSSLLARIDAGEITRVCQDLVRFRTVNPPGDEQAAAQYVADYLGKAGFDIDFVPLDAGRSSVLARLRGSGALPGLLMNGHIDVVTEGFHAWQHDPFAATLVDGKIWGRGASDMKGGVAAMMVAARTLAEAGIPLRGDLVFAATADEEMHMRGAKGICRERNLGPLQAVIISEPTYNGLGLAERGVLWLEIATHGKTAHASTPHLGVNAIQSMVKFLVELDQIDFPFQRHPILGDFTRSVDTISGGMKTNVVPDQCLVTIDMRTVPGQEHAAIVAQVEDLIARLATANPEFKASIDALYSLPSVETSPDHPAVQRFAAAAEAVMGHAPEPVTVRFATEAAIFVPALDLPAVIYGPGDPSLAHQPEEHVEIDKMVEAARVYAVAAADMLS